MCRMKVSASIQKASTPPGSSTHSARITSRSKRTCSVWVGREGGEVVACRRARRHRRRAAPRSTRPRPPQRPLALERARLLAGEHAVAVGAAAGVAAGVEAVGRGARERSTLTSSRQQGVQARGLHRLAGVARHLAARVHAAVGAPGHGQLHRHAGRPWPARPPARACTVRRPGWRAQPANPAPSYSSSSLAARATRACAPRSAGTRRRCVTGPSPPVQRRTRSR